MKLEIGKTCEFAPGSTPEEPQLRIKKPELDVAGLVERLRRRADRNRRMALHKVAELDEAAASALTALDERVKRTQDALDMQREVWRETNDAKEALQAENERLRGYARHKDGCDFAPGVNIPGGGPCNCGLDAALASEDGK